MHQRASWKKETRLLAMLVSPRPTAAAESSLIKISALLPRTWPPRLKAYATKHPSNWSWSKDDHCTLVTQHFTTCTPRRQAWWLLQTGHRQAVPLPFNGGKRRSSIVIKTLKAMSKNLLSDKHLTVIPPCSKWLPVCMQISLATVCTHVQYPVVSDSFSCRI